MEQTPAKRILIVDDDLAILEALELLLLDAGYEVDITTKNGGYIQEIISRHMPDLIILDVLLSGHDGRDICRRLKGGEETRHIPVIMLSAHPTARETSLRAGADDFLAKPFNIEELLSKVEHFLGPAR